MTETRSDPRPLRRDAAENREKLLDAAGRVFAEHGLDGSVDEVARLAGVGMGTLYRRFPTKQALIDELVGGARRELLARAQAAEVLDGGGLEQLLWSAGEFQAGQLGCLHQVWDQSDAELDAMRDFRRILARLLTDAQNAGRVRADVTRTDLSLVLWSVRGVVETTRTVAPGAWRRHLELLIAGLRPASEPFAGPLRERPLRDAEARRITGADAVD
jgi:AcrR family transcriptional regulator